MINLDHVHFQHKTVIYFVQTFGNIYTIVPFCKHALRVFHAIAWLILLAHAQTNSHLFLMSQTGQTLHINVATKLKSNIAKKISHDILEC